MTKSNKKSLAEELLTTLVFEECLSCSQKLGSPDLCKSCYHNRRAISLLRQQVAEKTLSLLEKSKTLDLRAKEEPVEVTIKNFHCSEHGYVKPEPKCPFHVKVKCLACDFVKEDGMIHPDMHTCHKPQPSKCEHEWSREVRASIYEPYASSCKLCGQIKFRTPKPSPDFPEVAEIRIDEQMKGIDMCRKINELVRAINTLKARE